MFDTLAAVVSGVQKNLEKIKGFSEAKVGKIRTACYTLKNPLQFKVGRVCWC